MKGVFAGAIIEVPAIAGLLWLLARLGVGDSEVAFPHLLRLTAVFAGPAALLTAGGIGRLAAHASAEGGRRRATLVAARAHAIATIGLVLIAALPHRHLPHFTGWMAMAGSAGAVGAATGAAIGLVCSGPSPVGMAEVVALARTPGYALQQLIDPDDLRNLGEALRDRTGHLLTEMFEPAAPPPADGSAATEAAMAPNTESAPSSAASNQEPTPEHRG